MSNESSTNSEKPTDAFLRKVKEKEEEAMALNKPKPVPNPMGEEHLRLQVHNSDPDQMKLLHSYYLMKGSARCKDCGEQLFTDAMKPRVSAAAQSFVENFDDSMPNGHPASSQYRHYKGWDGAGRTAALLAAGLRRLEAGQPDIVIKGFFLGEGISNKAQDYVGLVHEMHDANNLYRKWKELNPSHAAEKTNGGVTKT